MNHSHRGSRSVPRSVPKVWHVSCLSFGRCARDGGLPVDLRELDSSIACDCFSNRAARRCLKDAAYVFPGRGRNGCSESFAGVLLPSCDVPPVTSYSGAGGLRCQLLKQKYRKRGMFKELRSCFLPTVSRTCLFPEAQRFKSSPMAVVEDASIRSFVLS